tara:strand:- start:5400 stop:5594 length:195 start_codon:yes stop_codon:yes gene_type:complete
MAIKITANTVIYNDRYGDFTMVTTKSVNSMELTQITGERVGQTLYNTSTEKLVSWTGSAWVTST